MSPVLAKNVLPAVAVDAVTSAVVVAADLAVAVAVAAAAVTVTKNLRVL